MNLNAIEYRRVLRVRLRSTDDDFDRYRSITESNQRSADAVRQRPRPSWQADVAQKAATDAAIPQSRCARIAFWVLALDRCEKHVWARHVRARRLQSRLRSSCFVDSPSWTNSRRVVGATQVPGRRQFELCESRSFVSRHAQKQLRRSRSPRSSHATTRRLRALEQRLDVCQAGVA